MGSGVVPPDCSAKLYPQSHCSAVSGLAVWQRGHSFIRASWLAIIAPDPASLTVRQGGGHNRGTLESKGRSSKMKAICLVVAVGLLVACAAARAADLAPGDPAPEFSLPGSDGKTHRLSDYKGKQAVVLAWFPKAFTGG